MTTSPTTPTLAELATLAWKRLVANDNTMAALDWLREQADVDDVLMCKVALRKAGADYLMSINPGASPTTAITVRTLAQGDYSICLEQIGFLATCHDEWRLYAARALAVVAICQRIDGLPQ